jgi:hypothetical protein
MTDALLKAEIVRFKRDIIRAIVLQTIVLLAAMLGLKLLG